MKEDSHLFKALYLVGGTNKSEEKMAQGAACGFGKSAFVRASRINSLIAHTCVKPQDVDPVTRRLVGWTWWASHKHQGEHFEGRAIFGVDDGNSTVPYNDTEADPPAVHDGQRLNLMSSILSRFFKNNPIIPPGVVEPISIHFDEEQLHHGSDQHVFVTAGISIGLGRTPLLGPGVIRPPFVDRTRCKGSCQNHLYGCLWSYVSEHSGTNNNYWVLFSKSRSIHSSASVSRAHTAGGSSHSGFSRLVSICCGPQGYENGADDMDRKCSTQYFSLHCRNVGDSGAYATSIS